MPKLMHDIVEEYLKVKISDNLNTKISKDKELWKLRLLLMHWTGVIFQLAKLNSQSCLIDY